MANPQLLLRFRIDGEDGLCVKAATRIRIDGGGLTIIEPQTGIAETIPRGRIEVLSIQTVPGQRAA